MCITGPPPSESVNTAAKLLNELRVLSSRPQITVQVIHRLMGMLGDELSNPAHSLSTSILSTRGTTVKTINQKKYVDISMRTQSSSVSARRVPVRPIAMAKAVPGATDPRSEPHFLTRPP